MTGAQLHLFAPYSSGRSPEQVVHIRRRAAARPAAARRPVRTPRGALFLQPGLAVLAEPHPGLGGLALVSAEGAPVAQRHDLAVAGDVLVLAALIHAHRLVGEVD